MIWFKNLVFCSHGNLARSAVTNMTPVGFWSNGIKKSPADFLPEIRKSVQFLPYGPFDDAPELCLAWFYRSNSAALVSAWASSIVIHQFLPRSQSAMKNRRWRCLQAAVSTFCTYDNKCNNAHWDLSPNVWEIDVSYMAGSRLTSSALPLEQPSQETKAFSCCVLVKNNRELDEKCL